jgi:hypothetical protein
MVFRVDEDGVRLVELDEERQWCAPRGQLVDVQECVNGCVDHAQREICWMGRKAAGFEEAPDVQ